MEYRRFGSTIVTRLDPGEEILASLSKLSVIENISLAKVSGLGALSEAIIGLLNTVTHKYVSKTFEGMYEIASLNGSITSKDGEPYIHIHIVIGNSETQEFHCGHLSEAVVSATGEIFVEILDGEVGREFNPMIGMNIINFGK